MFREERCRGYKRRSHPKEIRSDESLLERIALLEKIYIPPNRCLPSKRLVCISEYPRVCCTS